MQACKKKLIEFFDKSTYDSEYYYFATSKFLTFRFPTYLTFEVPHKYLILGIKIAYSSKIQRS